MSQTAKSQRDIPGGTWGQVSRGLGGRTSELTTAKETPYMVTRYPVGAELMAGGGEA